MEGSGTIDDPYLVYNAYDLEEAKNDDYSHFLQMNDIDLIDAYIDEDFELFEIFGTFYGTYNGQGYSISNIRLKYSTSFFGNVYGDIFNTGKIMNVHLKNVRGYGETIASFVNICDSGIIKNCSAEGVLNPEGFASVSGFINTITGESLIENCSYIGELDGGDCYGFCGFVSGSSDVKSRIVDCSSETIIRSNNSASGGFGFYENVVTDNFNCTCDITNQGDFPMSGFISNLGTNASTNYCKIKGTIQSNGPVGGFIYTGGSEDTSESYSIITQSSAELDITTTATYGAVGGFIGIFDVNRNIEISKCFSMGSMTVRGNVDQIRVGGFIGDWSGGSDGGMIDSCFAAVDIDYMGHNRSYVGGFVGLFVDVNLNIEFGKCYSSGNIKSNSTYTGGFAGGIPGVAITPPFVIEGPVYWDTVRSGYPNSFGGANVIGKTTAELYVQAGYAGFDFDTIWMMPDETSNYRYAVLQWYYESPSENINIKILALLSAGDNDDNTIHEIYADSAEVSTIQQFTVVLLNELGKVDGALLPSGSDGVEGDIELRPIIMGVIDDENSTMTGFRGIYTSEGPEDAGSVVLLNSAGKISETMFYNGEEPYYEDGDDQEHLLLSIESEEDEEEGTLRAKHFGINYSRGAQDAAKVLILDKNGKINPSMLG